MGWFKKLKKVFKKITKPARDVYGLVQKTAKKALPIVAGVGIGQAVGGAIGGKATAVGSQGGILGGIGDFLGLSEEQLGEVTKFGLSKLSKQSKVNNAYNSMPPDLQQSIGGALGLPQEPFPPSGGGEAGGMGGNAKLLLLVGGGLVAVLLLTRGRS